MQKDSRPRSWGVKMIGTGACLPGEPITNEQLKERVSFPFDPQKHEAVTGIKQRHWGDANIATSDIAAEAGRQALERAGITAAQLDRIIVGTQTADYVNIAASCGVQHLLGATCPVGQVCRDDEIFLPIFGDGAGAVVLTSSNSNEGFIDIQLWADGSGAKDFRVPAGGSAMPASHETIDANLHGTVMYISGKQMAEQASWKMADLAKEILERNNITVDDIDVFIPHQANHYIMKKAAATLGLPLHKMEVSIDRVGNCIAGTVPITLNQAYEGGKLKPGSLILLTAAGAGYTGGAALYKVPAHSSI